MSAVNQNVVEFIERWKDKGDEKQHSQRFWFDLLESLFDVKNASQLVQFEERVELEHTSYIDIFIPKTKVIIEQKGMKIDLKKKAKQSDGAELTPFEQARRYNVSLPHSQKARWIVACNFQTFLIYDMENDPNGLNPLELKLEELGTKYNELRFLVEYQDQKIIEEQELSIKAGELIGRIYDLLKPQYRDPESDNSLKSLNKLCVRLVFCLYAEDAGLFDRKDNHIFGNYLKKTETKHLRKALIELFTVLNQDPDKNERDPYLDDELARFPYVNGNLFKIESPETDEIPNFTDEIKTLLVEECSESFDWADISPTIFGALFESTLNPETRRSGGMHYTSIENIHKVIDPLFLDDLKAEFDEIKQYKTEKKIRQECDRFQEKLASLKFLDPACGSGNFLTETYLCLRHLENELITFKSAGSGFLGIEEFNPVKVSISQFYGIEINDFAVAVANTALWIAESQMLHETENIIHREIDFLPLKTNSNIHQGNALRMDWEQIVPSSELNYIMGNPPFLGYSNQSKEQKEDMLSVYIDEKGKPYKTAGKIDYVSGWYMMAAKYIQETSIRGAFVSTNSVTQGEQVSFVWKPIYDHYKFQIDFAWKTFKWINEASEQAQVFCVIIGFSTNNETAKYIFDGFSINKVNQITPYLIDAPTVFIESQKTPLCFENSNLQYGSKPTDGGYLFISPEEKDSIEKTDLIAYKYIKRVYGATEFINNKDRYCLWLKDAIPHDLNKSAFIQDRLNKVRAFRLASTKKSTIESASTPYLFQEIRQPNSSYLLIPSHSSDKRTYIPIGYMSADVICTNANYLIENASLADFGIITSIVHMAWMRVVAGRIGVDYRYSSIVFNSFIIPEISEEQRRIILKTAQGILDARDLYPDSSLADLYDPLTMPPELLKAHKANDKAVLALYGFKPDATEEEIVAKLMQLYAEKVHSD